MNNSGAFADLFTFTRARAAPYRDATGAVQIAPVDVPRLDHESTGATLGLLIEGRPSTLKMDSCVIDADLPEGQVTILHDWVPSHRPRELRAIYSIDAHATIDGLLALQGHHRRIIVFEGYLRRHQSGSGPVRFDDEAWEMPALLIDTDNSALLLGDDHNSIMIEH